MSFLKQNKQYISTAMKIGVPSMMESFFVCLAGLIDSLMVSSLGAEAVAAVDITTQPKFLWVLPSFLPSMYQFPHL